MTRKSPIPNPSAPIRPDPDPTVLTTQALVRESDHLRELSDAIAQGMRQTFEMRLNAMDKAIALVHETTEKFPALIDACVAQLKDVDQVKFEAIRDRFSDAKLALDVALQGASKAVDAAFSAAKEAASKIELSFTKQIDQLQSLTAAQQKGTDDKIDDLRTRLTGAESIKKGSDNSGAFAIALASVVIAFVAAVAAVAAFFKR